MLNLGTSSMAHFSAQQTAAQAGSVRVVQNLDSLNDFSTAVFVLTFAASSHSLLRSISDQDSPEGRDGFSVPSVVLAGRWPTQAGLCVQSHDILYKMSPDILYTPARAQRAREHTFRCHGRRWMSENNE
jgi:hypothetical protein